MKTAIFYATLLASNIAMAATPIDGWYGSVFGGYTDMPNNLSTTVGGFTRTDASYKSGYNAGGQIGFKSNPMRYEGEITYVQADLEHFAINKIRQFAVNGNTSGTFGMANIYYDFFDFVPAIAPFAGLGLGYGWIDSTMSSNTVFGPTSFHGSNSVFAYQATAGLTYNFSENYALNIAYRYIGTDRVDDLGRVFQANLATAGVVYRFNAATYK